mmetsp:Transcript_36555/g.91869  ORF Transcript_36555/g.91869 Transcript_36555/m.91869 type:complete len:256 (+) Transcript_36555:284-1051(+)
MLTMQLTTSASSCKRSRQSLPTSRSPGGAPSQLAPAPPGPTSSSGAPLIRRSITGGVTKGTFSRVAAHWRKVSARACSLLCVSSRKTWRRAISEILGRVTWLLFFCSIAASSFTFSTTGSTSACRPESTSISCPRYLSILSAVRTSELRATRSATTFSTLRFRFSDVTCAWRLRAPSRASGLSEQTPPCCRSSISTTWRPWRTASSSGVPPVSSTGLTSTFFANGRFVSLWQLSRKWITPSCCSQAARCRQVRPS